MPIFAPHFGLLMVWLSSGVAGLGFVLSLSLDGIIDNSVL